MKTPTKNLDLRDATLAGKNPKDMNRPELIYAIRGHMHFDTFAIIREWRTEMLRAMLVYYRSTPKPQPIHLAPIEAWLECPTCGKPAFFFRKRPRAGELLLSGNVIHSDNPETGEKIRCQYCKTPLNARDLVDRNLRPATSVAIHSDKR